MWDNLGVRVDVENCAHLWKNPGFAPAYRFTRDTYVNSEQAGLQCAIYMNRNSPPP